MRPILFRASVSEMVVPYGHPGPMHAWKSAFDAGEWGLGRMANSLTLGCDCLGEIRYFDDVFADEKGKPHTRANAICMHEEDYGILWKHVDMVSGRTEVRRSRRLVVSSIATVGNYEYGFYWYFYLDGTIQLEVKLTGIMSTMAVAERRRRRPRQDGGAGSGCAVPPAPLQRPARHRGRRPRQRGIRGRRGGCRRAGHAGKPVGQRLRHDRDPARDRVGGAARRRPLAQPDLAHRQPLDPQRRRRADGVQAAARVDADAAGPPGLERGAAGRLRLAQPVGHAVRTRGAAGGRRLPQPAPRRRRPARSGRRRTGRSSTPTSCCGTRSASPTSPGPRTGRSCRSSTPASPWSRSASSTATPRSTCRPRPTTATIG